MSFIIAENVKRLYKTFLDHVAGISDKWFGLVGRRFITILLYIQFFYNLAGPNANTTRCNFSSNLCLNCVVRQVADISI